MEFVAIPLLVAAVIGAIMARWTAMHPVVAGVLIGLVGYLSGGIVLGGFLGPVPWAGAILIGVPLAGAGAVGGFLGWLRRTHMRRMIGWHG